MSVHKSKHITTVFAVLIFLISSCGIEDAQQYLFYQPRTNSESPTSINFYPPEQYETQFTGIDIYYKIYASKTDADADASSFSVRQDADIIPGSSIVAYLLSPNALNYHRLYNYTQQSRFVITKSLIPSTNNLVTFELTVINELLFKIDNIEVAKLYRNTATDTIPFSMQPNQSDSDFKYSSNDQDPQFYIQLYAVSYGYTNLLKPIFSKAVKIGVLSIVYN
ncbi:MAG TPA: hypothetical protein PK074_02085 [Spirochaetales bacterium]|nr:hypothetical protein [Spirochaetales bacterium]HRV27284.1 hypothetical protein [Spirochaetia bacterium]HOT60119.1 hypothetical protein [Spirochaetales bacterium]HPD80906.1 hypothetical protein [Spirochaetales bacterium]HQG39826.1 hypothetical protein [Spirochaetales bacterium]